MRRLTWTMDAGGLWEMDVETPAAMEGVARSLAARQRCNGDGPTLLFPLGLSRGARLSRAKQLDFMHRFMASPLVPSFSGPRNGGHGVSLQRADSFHLRENWSVTIMEQFHLQKFVSLLKKLESKEVGSSGSNGAVSWIRNVGALAMDAYRRGFGTEFVASRSSSLLFEAYGDDEDGKGYRNKAVFTHKFPGHDLVMEAASPRLYSSGDGTYWDVPLSMAIDLASTPSTSGAGYHFCLQQNKGQPRSFCHAKSSEAPPSLLPGFCAKAVVSIKKSVDIWRKRDGMKKMKQPFDVFQCDPHISVSGTLGAALCAFMGENSVGLCKEEQSHDFKPLSLSFSEKRSSIFADSYAAVSCTGQIGHFQKLILDLTRFQARLDCPSVTNLLHGSFHLIRDNIKGRDFNPNAVYSICPDLTLSFQQQLVGPVSFRAESRFGVDLMKSQGRLTHSQEHFFALEYAMHVLGSARATAWYSPKRQEAMVELRFFET
ncbi:pigment defective 320 [Wolffia australiana]